MVGKTLNPALPPINGLICMPTACMVTVETSEQSECVTIATLNIASRPHLDHTQEVPRRRYRRDDPSNIWYLLFYALISNRYRGVWCSIWWDSIPCYGDWFQMQWAAHFPYHQTCYYSILTQNMQLPVWISQLDCECYQRHITHSQLLPFGKILALWFSLLALYLEFSCHAQYSPYVWFIIFTQNKFLRHRSEPQYHWFILLIHNQYQCFHWLIEFVSHHWFISLIDN